LTPSKQVGPPPPLLELDELPPPLDELDELDEPLLELDELVPPLLELDELLLVLELEALPPLLLVDPPLLLVLEAPGSTPGGVSAGSPPQWMTNSEARGAIPKARRPRFFIFGPTKLPVLNSINYRERSSRQCVAPESHS